MKSDTYDVRPYHFGILTYDRAYLKELGNSDDSIDEYINGRFYSTKYGDFYIDNLLEELLYIDGIIIDFSNIDCLTIEDLERLDDITNNKVIFIMYDIVPYISNDEVIYESIPIHCTIMDVEDSRKRCLLYEIIEKNLLDIYNESNEDIKERIKCFLQKYRFGTKEKVKKYLKEKNK